MKPRNGAEILVNTLEELGIRLVFGVPGTQNVPLFEALRKSRIQTILATSELSAALMAGAAGRLSGTAGVVITIPGPGFAWALPGIAEARLDSAPLLAIAGSPPDAPRHRHFRQQELPQGAIAGPLVKAVLQASHPDGIAAVTRSALKRSMEGEPGPVLLHVPSGTMGAEAVDQIDLPIESEPKEARGLEQLVERMRQARRPICLVGQGAWPVAAQLRRLADRWNAPFLSTPSGRGTISEDHPLALGFDGVAHPVTLVNDLVRRSDLVLVLGAKLGHNGTAGFGLELPADRLVQIDASAEVVGLNYPTSLRAVASLETVLPVLLSVPLAAAEWSAVDLAEVRRRIRETRLPLTEPRVSGTPERTPAGFFTALRGALPRETVLVLDSGLHQILARRHYEVLEPGGLLFPSDLQSMGFGIPAAIGARLAAPNRPVVALVGDGGFLMTGFDIGTAVREQLDLIVVVFRDGALGQIRLQQLEEYGATNAVELPALDLELLALGLGARYVLAGQDIAAVMTAALTRGGVTVVEVPVGDSVGLRAKALAARLKELVRKTPARNWLRRLRRGRQPP